MQTSSPTLNSRDPRPATPDEHPHRMTAAGEPAASPPPALTALVELLARQAAGEWFRAAHPHPQERF